MNTRPVRVCCSYAREDAPLLVKLLECLHPLERAGRLEILTDRQIAAGSEWQEVIRHQITSAQIILVLVSASYLASEYCLGELSLAREQHRARKAVVVPVVLRPVDWKLPGPEMSFLSRLQSLPGDRVPVMARLMPDQAYVEIVEGIRKLLETLEKAPESSDQVIRVSNVHVPRKEYFVDRVHVLSQIHEDRLKAGDSLMVHALTGISGIGKSEVAIEYVQRYSGDYSVIWWCHASTRQALRRSLSGLASALGLAASAAELPDLITQYATWLWICDDVKRYEDIMPFVPTHGPGHIIITSQSEHWYRAAKYDLKPLKQCDATALLTRITDSRVDDRGAPELAQRVGGIPLALESFAAVALAARLPLASCCEDLRFGLQDVSTDLEFRNRQMLDAAWSRVMNHLEGVPDAVRTLRICAMLEPNEIPRRILRALVSGLDSAVITLLNFSLVRTSADTVSLQPFFQEWVFMRLSEADRHALLDEVAAELDRQLEATSVEPALVTHALRVASRLRDSSLCSPAVGLLLARCGMCLFREGDKERAVPLLRKSEEVLRPLAEGKAQPVLQRCRYWRRLADVRGALGDADGQKDAMVKALALANEGDQRYDNGYGYFDEVMPRSRAGVGP